MIKGLAITPPVIGRISIGKLVQKNDKWLPEKDDSFTLTTQVQNREGWLLHPLHQVLAEQANNGKIRAIPVRTLFNSSALNLRAEYCAFDRATGRPLCVGDGESARQYRKEGVEEVTCLGPDRCQYGKEAGCKLFGRLNVQVDGQQDALGTFIFRTTGYNSVRTLAARLRYFEALSGGLTHYLPLLLRLRAKSTTQSYRAPVYYVDLTLRDGAELPAVIADARAEAASAREAGIDDARLEQTALQLLRNGQFEETEEDTVPLLEEFYSTETTTTEEPLPPAPRPVRLTRQLGKNNAA